MSRTRHTAGLLARNSVLNLAGQLLPLAVGVLTMPMIVRGLGPDAFGILSIVWMLLGSFGVFDLGLGRATTKFVAESLAPGKIHRVPSLIYTSVGLQTGLGALGGLAFAACAPLLADRFFTMPPAWVPEARRSLLFLAGGVPVMLFANSVRGVLEAAQRFDLVNYVKVPTSVAFYLVAAIGVPLNLSVSAIVALSVAVRVVSAIVYAAMCIRVFPGLRTGMRLSRREIPALFSFGGWVMVSNAAGPLMGYLERFIIAAVISVGALTYYAVPFEMLSRAMIIPGSIAPALFPYFSSCGDGGRKQVSDVTSRTLTYMLLMMTPLLAVTLAFGGDILSLWMGPAFAAQSTVVLQILAVAFFLNAFAYVPFTSVHALGRPDLKAILDLVALPLFGVSAWLLMLPFGIAGAAAAKALITVVDFGFLFWFASKLGAFSWRDCVSGPLLRALVLSAGLVAGVWMTGVAPLPRAAAIGLAALFTGAYLVAFWAKVFRDEERAAARSLPFAVLPAGALQGWRSRIEHAGVAQRGAREDTIL